MRRSILAALVLAGCGGLVDSEPEPPAVGRYAYRFDMPRGYVIGEYAGTLHVTQSGAERMVVWWEVEGFDREPVGSGSRVGIGDTYYLMARSTSGGIATRVGGEGQDLHCVAGVITSEGLRDGSGCTLTYLGR
jgi:hypothetical protein